MKEHGRTPFEAIESILSLIPETETDLLAELKKCSASALYAAPEDQRRVFKRASDALEEGLVSSPLDGWKEAVRAIWMTPEVETTPKGSR